jgi:hypothetical protein
MYYITHPFLWWSYKRAFTKFHDAFMMQQLVAPDAQIEFFDGMSREVVWKSEWEYSWC